MADTGGEWIPTGEKAVSLSERIEALKGQSTVDAVDELLEITDGLSAELTLTGTRSIRHDTITGTGDLDALVKEFLRIGHAISNSQYTPLQTRLYWGDLWDRFDALYKACRDSAQGHPFGAVLRRLRDTTIGCPCCSGVPHVVITSGFDSEIAYQFPEEEFKKLWPKSKNEWGVYRSTGHVRRSASRKMVEEALAISGKLS